MYALKAYFPERHGQYFRWIETVSYHENKKEAERERALLENAYPKPEKFNIQKISESDGGES